MNQLFQTYMNLKEKHMSLLDSPTVVLEEVGATPAEYISNVNKNVSQVVKRYYV